MSLTMALAFSGLLAFKNANLTPILELKPVAEASEVFLQTPFDMTIDAEGRFYVVDAFAKTVFVWNPDGSFVGNFGKGGEGPGEFRFTNMGGPQAYLGVMDQQIMVFDGANQSVNLFAKDFTYQKTIPLKIPQGRTEYFKVTPQKQYVVYQQKWGENPKRMITLYDAEGNQVNEITSVVDTTYALRKNESGGFGGLTLNAYSPRLTVHYGRLTNEVVTGTFEEPHFEIYNLKGELQSKVNFKMVQPEVTKETQKEYEETSWVKEGLKNGFLKVSYPEKMAYYTNVLPLKNTGYLVYRRSPHLANMDGIVVNRQGETLSRFNLTCGENGSLHSVDGRLIAIMLDDEGEFVIREYGLSDLGS